MKEFNAEEVRLETVTAIGAFRQAEAYIGLDVHKETIAVAVARVGREDPEFRGEIANKPKKVALVFWGNSLYSSYTQVTLSTSYWLTKSTAENI
jgi:hypothetical protein